MKNIMSKSPPELCVVFKDCAPVIISRLQRRDQLENIESTSVKCNKTGTFLPHQCQGRHRRQFNLGAQCKKHYTQLCKLKLQNPFILK